MMQSHVDLNFRRGFTGAAYETDMDTICKHDPLLVCAEAVNILLITGAAGTLRVSTKPFKNSKEVTFCFADKLSVELGKKKFIYPSDRMMSVLKSITDGDLKVAIHTFHVGTVN